MNEPKSTKPESINVTGQTDLARVNKQLQLEINECKRAEEAVRVSKEKYKALYENAPLSYQSLNEDGIFIDVNPAWLKTLGYDRKEVIGKLFGDFLHPDWKPHFEKNFQEFKRCDYAHDVQFKVRHKDGHYLDISFEGYIGYNPDGSFKQTYCVLQDITERKQAEEALTNALGEWRVTFDSAKDLIMMLDVDFKIHRANLATERFLNRPIKEITGKTCYQLFHGTNMPPEGCPLENMRNTKKHEEKEFYLFEKDIWILASVDPILDDKGNVTGAVHIIRDITERKLAKEKLLKERALLNAIIDNIPVLLTRYDPDANMLYLNKEFEKKIGWKTEEVKDIDMMEKVYPDPDYRQQALEYMQKASTEWREFRVQSKSGKVIDSEWSNIQLEDGTQIGIGIDITERKQADEALRLHAAMMDNVAEGIYLTGLDDLIIKWTNEKFEKMFGYDPGEMVGKQVDIVNAPTERTPTETRIKIVDVLKETGGWHGEVRNMKHDGTHFWCYANVSLFDHPEYGTVIVSVHTDITKRKRAEKMLQRSEALLNATQQLSKVGGWEWDVKNQTMFWTDEVYRIHDFQPSKFTPGSIEHIERSIECYDPEDRPVIMEAFRNCAENGQAYNLEFSLTTPMGRKIWIQTVANPVLKDQRVVKVVGNIMDITERKQVEEALRQSEKDLRLRIQINNIFLTHPDEEMFAEILKLIRKAMESKYGTFGYFDENGSFVAPAVTRKIYWDKCNVPEKNIIFQKGTFGGIWGRAIKERKTLISNDGPFQIPKGHIPIENTIVTPIIFHEEVISAIHIANKPNGYNEQDQRLLETIAEQISPVLYARLQRDKKDVQRKEAEEEIHKLNEELEQRVKERTAELEKKNKELETMNRGFVMREHRVIELKKKVAELENNAKGEE